MLSRDEASEISLCKLGLLVAMIIFASDVLQEKGWSMFSRDGAENCYLFYVQTGV